MFLYIIYFLEFLLCYVLAKPSTGPIVNTNNGIIEGRSIHVNEKSVHIFMGIPFAEPPVGPLRFKKPLPKTEWYGTYVASDIKPQCIQPTNTSVMSEDCLYLNIWTPTLKKCAKLSVMLWIHGGSFLDGSATELNNGFNIYDGTQLALNDVIVVTANYRLGAFGFLFGDSNEAPGNMGYWDQAMALNWTKLNIEAFGGNPNDITIFGESAGSISVSSHIISPITKHWFNKAIMQSGSTYIRQLLADKESALDFSRNFAKNPNFFPTNPCINDQWIQCLKNKSAAELNSAQTLQYLAQIREIVIFKPIFNDEFLPKDVDKSIREANFNKEIKLLIGHNEMEGLSFATAIDSAFGLNGRYNPQIPLISNISKTIVFNDIKLFIPNDTISGKIATAYTEQFPDSELSLNKNSLRRSAVYAYGDATITFPTILFGAKLVKHSKFRGKVYQYRLTYANSKSMAYKSVWANVTHTDDLPLVFGRPFNEKFNNWTIDDEVMSQKFLETWTYFAKEGTPPTVNGRKWPEYRSRSDGNVILSYVELSKNPSSFEKIYKNRYKGNDGYSSNVINNYINFWDDILTQQF